MVQYLRHRFTTCKVEPTACSSLCHGNPLVGLPLTAAHFARWVELWRATVDARYEGPRATHAKDAAARMTPALRVPGSASGR